MKVSSESVVECLIVCACFLILAIPVTLLIIAFVNHEPTPPPRFCPNNEDRQFEKMMQSVWNPSAGTSEYLCTNSTNIIVEFQKVEVGVCEFNCNRSGRDNILVKCPISLVGLKYSSNDDGIITNARCEEGNFTVSFFVGSRNIVEVPSIQVHDGNGGDLDDKGVNWLTYLARKYAVKIAKKNCKIRGKFQFLVVEYLGILSEKPGKFCCSNRNPTCH